MSWQIKSEDGTAVVLLENELGIQNAAEFHQAVLPLAVTGGSVRVDARATKSVHTSIMQILHALSQAVPDFGVTDASEDFRATEARLGLSLARIDQLKTSIQPSGPA
jgi:anti-anti-sigma regulatory factor